MQTCFVYKIVQDSNDTLILRHISITEECFHRFVLFDCCVLGWFKKQNVESQLADTVFPFHYHTMSEIPKQERVALQERKEAIFLQEITGFR